jgi:hypothetical protein
MNRPTRKATCVASHLRQSALACGSGQGSAGSPFLLPPLALAGFIAYPPAFAPFRAETKKDALPSIVFRIGI